MWGRPTRGEIVKTIGVTLAGCASAYGVYVLTISGLDAGAKAWLSYRGEIVANAENVSLTPNVQSAQPVKIVEVPVVKAAEVTSQVNQAIADGLK